MEEFKNKVIARDYVEKNYVKKKDLLEWLQKEIKLCRDEDNPLLEQTNKDFIEGILYSYSALFNYLIS